MVFGPHPFSQSAPSTYSSSFGRFLGPVETKAEAEADALTALDAKIVFSDHSETPSILPAWCPAWSLCFLRSTCVQPAGCPHPPKAWICVVLQQSVFKLCSSFVKIDDVRENSGFPNFPGTQEKACALNAKSSRHDVWDRLPPACHGKSRSCNGRPTWEQYAAGKPTFATRRLLNRQPCEAIAISRRHLSADGHRVRV